MTTTTWPTAEHYAVFDCDDLERIEQVLAYLPDADTEEQAVFLRELWRLRDALKESGETPASSLN